MRVIAIVTFLLLPATFVSTFFSTDVVKYQDGEGNNSSGATTSRESFSPLALQRWLFVVLAEGAKDVVLVPEKGYSLFVLPKEP
ncbi:hypothetical protein WAI453_002574 [Rhynchosporium graminicola]